MDPLSQGREYYQKKDYQSALETFSKAVAVSSGHILLTALDNRAATFEKLKQFQDALKDSRKMITLKPELAKGYLRCGKVLQLKGEEKPALKIYERGLNKIKINTDNDRILLQKVFNNLHRKLGPPECFDPLVKLPPELAVMVSRYLTVKDAVVCLSVSKGWTKFLESCPDVWTTLDFRYKRRPPSWAALKTFLRRSNYGLLHVHMRTPTSEPTNRDFLSYILQTCPLLQTLHLSSGILGNSFINAIAHAQDLRSLQLTKDVTTTSRYLIKTLAACPYLESATFCSVAFELNRSIAEWPQMNHLRSFCLRPSGMDGYTSISSINLDSFAKASPELRSLQLAWCDTLGGPQQVDFQKWTKLESLSLTRCNLSRIPLFPPLLKHLDLSDTIYHRYLDAADDDICNTHLSSLESFSSPNIESWSLDASFKLIQPAIQAQTLTSLRIRSEMDTTSPLSGMLIPSDSVKYLYLDESMLVEVDIIKILRSYPNLQEVSLSHTHVTGVTIRELVDREPPVRRLNLNYCRLISSDAAEYARAKGVLVLMSLCEVSRRRKFRDQLMY